MNMLNTTEFFTLKWLNFLVFEFPLNKKKERKKTPWVIYMVVEVTKNGDTSRDREELSEPGIRSSVNRGE